MLYDPKWGQPSLAGFTAWLAQQPADRPYDYWPCPTCAIGQYLRSMDKSEVDLAPGVYYAWNHEIAKPLPWTFGAAHERARQFLVTP